jgi:hypothetical protein
MKWKIIYRDGAGEITLPAQNIRDALNKARNFLQLDEIQSIQLVSKSSSGYDPLPVLAPVSVVPVWPPLSAPA